MSNQFFGKYSTLITALISGGLVFASLYWGGNKYVAIAVAVASALGVHVAHVNSTKPSMAQLQQALIAQGIIRPGILAQTPQQPPARPTVSPTGNVTTLPTLPPPPPQNPA